MIHFQMLKSPMVLCSPGVTSMKMKILMEIDKQSVQMLESTMVLCSPGMTSLSGSSFSMSAGKGARPVSPAMIQVSINTNASINTNTNTITYLTQIQIHSKS